MRYVQLWKRSHSSVAGRDLHAVVYIGVADEVSLTVAVEGDVPVLERSNSV